MSTPFSDSTIDQEDDDDDLFEDAMSDFPDQFPDKKKSDSRYQDEEEISLNEEDASILPADDISLNDVEAIKRSSSEQTLSPNKEAPSSHRRWLSEDIKAGSFKDVSFNVVLDFRVSCFFSLSHLLLFCLITGRQVVLFEKNNPN